MRREHWCLAALPLISPISCNLFILSGFVLPLFIRCQADYLVSSKPLRRIRRGAPQRYPLSGRQQNRNIMLREAQQFRRCPNVKSARQIPSRPEGRCRLRQVIIHGRVLFIRAEFIFKQSRRAHSHSFDTIAWLAGVERMKLQPQSPNLNAFVERWVCSLKKECLDQLIPFGEYSLRQALQEYLAHHKHERNH